jgi:hypothetical protein
VDFRRFFRGTLGQVKVLNLLSVPGGVLKPRRAFFAPAQGEAWRRQQEQLVQQHARFALFDPEATQGFQRIRSLRKTPSLFEASLIGCSYPEWIRR